jgi:Lrp/AsnC family leucine-responsive transcriptional regulator
MDDIDYRLVDLLQRDGRATQLELAREVKVSQPAVAERIRKLEQAGVITGYAAQVAPGRLGIDITAFIGVNIEHPKYFADFAEIVQRMPEVLECHRVAGPESYILKVRAANTQGLDQLLVETLRTIAGVTRTQTTIVLSSIKEGTYVQPPRELKGNGS